VPADVIILANGFVTSKWLHPLKISGVDGRDLISTMDERGGSQAYQGTAMDGFPNFFMIFGPNTTTGHSSVILASENMTDYAMKFVAPILKGDIKTVDVKKEAEVAYTHDIQKKLKNTVFMSGGCSSWYYTKDGWNSTVLPYNQIWFWYRCQFPKFRDWNIRYTTKGLLKLLAMRCLKLTGLAMALFALLRFYRFKRVGGSFSEQLDTYRSILGMGTVFALDRAKKAVLRSME